MQHLAGQLQGVDRGVLCRGRTHGRGAVIVQRAGEPLLPYSAVLRFDVFCEPSIPLLVGGHHVGEKFPQASVIVFLQQRLGIWSNQKIHVSAGSLLCGAVLQLTQKRAGVWCIQNHQTLHALRVLVGHIPRHGTAPVVRHQCGQGLLWAFKGYQR